MLHGGDTHYSPRICCVWLGWSVVISRELCRESPSCSIPALIRFMKRLKMHGCMPLGAMCMLPIQNRIDKDTIRHIGFHSSVSTNYLRLICKNRFVWPFGHHYRFLPPKITLHTPTNIWGLRHEGCIKSEARVTTNYTIYYNLTYYDTTKANLSKPHLTSPQTEVKAKPWTSSWIEMNFSKNTIQRWQQK